MKTTLNLPETKILSLIQKAKNAELCRNVAVLEEILSPIWTDFDSDPDLSEYIPCIEADLLRICGTFLINYGRAKNVSKYHLRAKNLLSNAITIFDDEKLKEKSAEAKVMMAFAYWNTGEVNESKVWIDMVEEEFGYNPYHPIFLQIKINRLLILYYETKIPESLTLVKEIEPFVEYCADEKLCAMFHNQAGITYDLNGDQQRSLFHYNEAARIGKKINNSVFVALIFNNLAMLHIQFKEYTIAKKLLENSVQIFKQINNLGLLPHVLDTQAIVYYKTSEYAKSLTVVNSAIEMFRKGEHFTGLVSALWTKIQCLIKLNQKLESLRIFGELQSIAAAQIGAVAVEKYEKLFADQIHFVKDLSLDENVKDFRRSLVREAVIKGKGQPSKIAEILKVKRGKVTDMLINQYPEMRAEEGFKARVRGPNKIKAAINKFIEKQA